MLLSGIAGLNELQDLRDWSGEAPGSIANRAMVRAVSRVDSVFSDVPGDTKRDELSGVNNHVGGSFAEAVVLKIRRRDQAGIEDLYGILTDGAHARLLRRVAPEFREDRRHEILVIVVAAIRNGELREPKGLMGFIWTVTRRRVAAYIRGAMFERRRFVPGEEIELLIPVRESAEILVIERERAERVRLTIRALRPRDREILERFYFKEQPSEQICAEMRLTATQFRLFKSRAIARCGHRMRGVSAASPANSRARLAARIA